ncbi:MAG: hypothetical protein CVT98_11015 [Bacteroidetes bacterium HGW-Bacteroidetes-15]|nr:MAG: hypothetical protein CVT98_11015 [Bacteroidetes bacterium HGW-Bacteroidetes-15]
MGIIFQSGKPNLYFSDCYYNFCHNFNSHWTYKLSVYQGCVAGDDSKSDYNPERNLSFKSNITEISAVLELNFFEYKTGSDDRKFSPFIFGGVSLFKFNPQAKYKEQWYYLKPLGTEGQGTTDYSNRLPYNLVSLGFPFGIGIKYNIVKYLCISGEWGMRKTFTDYIDDVSTTYANSSVLSSQNTPMSAILADRTEYNPSEEHIDKTDFQRGNPTNNDWFSFIGITITFKLKDDDNTCNVW